jgi:hypothetical protein
VKRWMMVALVAVLAAGLVPVAIAGTGSDGDRSQFMVEGTVQYIEAGDGCNYVVLTPSTGTRDVKDIVRAGTAMTVKLPDGVSVIECVPPPGSVVIPLSDVGPNDTVMARGVIDRSGSTPEYVAFRFQLMSYAAAPSALRLVKRCFAAVPTNRLSRCCRTCVRRRASDMKTVRSGSGRPRGAAGRV